MFFTSQLSSRNEFGKLLNERNLLGTAIEVGTNQGDFASIFLDTWKGELLYCVDPWDNPPDYIRQARTLGGDGNRNNDFIAAKRALRKHNSRVEFLQMLSSEAAKWRANNSVDFIYLDGNHEPPYVEQDIRLWWPKLRSGGILAGHDIVMPGEVDGGWGQYIQPAVFRFAEDWGLDVHLVVEEGGLPWSYHMTKN